ncbi:MAG TPA: sugar ABC transporter permease [Pseudonocardiaceae bacterium]|jgi:multiple sugar transport system permease protein|nr:sugar ABC transporter permease [Pseudonocardiaceae bacterium]
MTATTDSTTVTPAGPTRLTQVSRVGRGRGRLRRKVADNLIAYTLLAGGVLCFAVFSWYPIVRAVLLSFQHTNFVGTSTWVGWKNFHRLFTDPEFVAAWRNTFEFTGIALVIGFAIPFVLAVVLNEMRHARTLFRLLVYLPVMIPPVITAILWKWFYDPGDGLFNDALRFLHLPTSDWTNSTSTAIISLVLVSTWANMGGTVLIYLAALQNVPGDLYEAAELDGANILQRVRHVTVPQTRYVMLMLMLLQIVATMQVFTEPFIITGGGPQDATITVLYLIYKYAFVYFDYGAACALSVLLLVFLAIFSAFYLRLTRNQD